MFDNELLRLKKFEDFFYRLTNISEDFHDYFISKKKRKIKAEKENCCHKFFNFFFKILFLFITFLLIIYLYYHFIFVIICFKLVEYHT